VRGNLLIEDARIVGYVDLDSVTFSNVSSAVPFIKLRRFGAVSSCS